MKKLIKLLLDRFQNRQVALLTKKKIKLILSHIRKAGEVTNISSEITEKHKKLWSGYRSKVTTEWLKAYVSVSGITDYRYIPENIYYCEIEPRLNDKIFSKAYTDKNSYHKILDNNILIPIVLRSISGVYYTQDYQLIDNIDSYFNNNVKDGTYIIKPSIESGGGRNVRKIILAEKRLDINPSINGINDMRDLINYYKRDFVIQEYLEQNSFFRQFNPSSLNTIRIFTYRSLKNEEIIILCRVIRMGEPGSIVDNCTTGGVACGISEKGVLSSFGVGKFGDKFYESNSIKFGEVGTVPYMDSISLLAKEVARQYHYSRLVSVDFAVNDKGKVFLVEVNASYNEVNFCQLNNGPLFGDYSQEVADLTHKEPRSILLQ